MVASLYKAFAWMTLSSSEHLFGKPLVQQEATVLRRYFDAALTASIIEDRRCIEKSAEICNLDFDPIFATQDPGATDFSIHPKSDGVVAVEFTYPSSRERIRLEYRMVQTEGTWRIADIWYPGLSDSSLKQILSRKLPTREK